MSHKEVVRAEALVLLLLGAVALCLFWPLVFGRAHLVPFHILAGDPALQGLDGAADRPDWRTYDLAPITTSYAEKALFSHGLYRGEFPLWNPYNGLGVPLLADGQSQALAPFFFPFMAFPNPWVYSLCLVVQILFGGLGMDRLLRALGVGFLSRVVGAILFAFNPYALKYLAFSDTWVYVWFPWLFLCAEWMATSRRGHWALGVTVSLAAASGHFEVAFMGATAAWLYFVVRSWKLGGEGRKRALRLMSLSPAGVALLLSAWWVIPFIEWVHLSVSDRMHVFKPIPYDWRALFLWGSELLFPPLLLALAFLGLRQSKAGPSFLPALAWSLLLLFPVPQALQVVLSLGFMSNRYGRSLAWFSLITLAALGLHALGNAKLTRLDALCGLALFAAWLGGMTAGLSKAAAGPEGVLGRVPLEGQAVASLPVAWALLALGIASWIVAWSGTGHRPWFVPGAMAICLVASVFTMPPSTWAGWNRSTPKLSPPLASLAPEVTGREWLPSMRGLQSLSPNLSAAFGLRDIRYVMPLTPKRLLPLAEPLEWGFAGFYSPKAEILEMCGVSRGWSIVPSSGGSSSSLSERVLTGQLTRGFWVPMAEIVPEARTALRRAMEGSAWREKAFIEGAPSGSSVSESPRAPRFGGLAAAPSPAMSGAQVRMIKERCNSSSWEVRCSAPGWFVLRDLYWPGWGAEIDGRPAAVYAADGVFRAVAVESGDHTIKFAYRPLSVTVGVVISLLTLCALAALSAARRKRSHCDDIADALRSPEEPRHDSA